MIFQCVVGEYMCGCDDISVCRRRVCMCHDLNFFPTIHQNL